MTQHIISYAIGDALPLNRAKNLRKIHIFKILLDFEAAAAAALYTFIIGD